MERQAREIENLEFARKQFISSIGMALAKFNYEDVDSIFLKVMEIYYQKYASVSQTSGERT